MDLKENEIVPLHKIMQALQQAGIGVTPKTQGILEAYTRDTLAVDDTILIVAPQDLKGWSDPSQIEIVNFSPDERLIDPPSLDQLAKQYGPIRKPLRNEPKFTILSWEKRWSDSQSVLALGLGQSSMEENIAIEFMASHPILEISQGLRCTLYEAYHTKVFDFWTHLPNLITVTPVVVTSDNRVLVSRRSPEVFYYPAHWEISISEQMNPNEPLDRDSFFFGAIKRGIWEELGQVEISRIRVLGLYREVSSLNVNVGALVRVAVREEEIQKAMLRAIDRDEHSVVEFQAWNPENLVRLLSSSYYQSYTSSELSGPYHPSSRMRLLLAMLAEFPHTIFVQLLNQFYQPSQSDKGVNFR